MKRHALLALLGILLVAALALAAPTGPPRAQVFVLSNSQPNISVIDAETNRVTNTANVPSMTSWPWNDDNNYFDGTHLWLGVRNPSTNDVEVGLLNLDTLRIDHRIPLGQDRVSVYIGKPSRTGRLLSRSTPRGNWQRSTLRPGRSNALSISRSARTAWPATSRSQPVLTAESVPISRRWLGTE